MIYKMQNSLKINLKVRRGLLPVGWQETFSSAASQLALTQKSPASRLAADLKVSCQPATITYQIKYFIGIYMCTALFIVLNPTLNSKSIKHAWHWLGILLLPSPSKKQYVYDGLGSKNVKA